MSSVLKKHHGTIIEKAVRNSGLSISDVAKKLIVERKSLYNWFNAASVKPETIYLIGNAINHDFSIDFPEYFTPKDFHIIRSHAQVLAATAIFNAPDAICWKDKYLQLLEKHQQLLDFKLTQVTDNM